MSARSDDQIARLNTRITLELTESEAAAVIRVLVAGESAIGTMLEDGQIVGRDRATLQTSTHRAARVRGRIASQL